MPNLSRSRTQGMEGKGSIGRAKSFHGRTLLPAKNPLIRPKTVPELLPTRKLDAAAAAEKQEAGPPRLTKLLLNVTVQGSLGPVQVIISPDLTVGELIGAVVRQYGKEGRRPLLPTTKPTDFDLHYSQFSLESLDPKEKLITLGSRNFFLRAKPLPAANTSCANQAEKAATKMGFAWLKFMNFFL